MTTNFKHINNFQGYVLMTTTTTSAAATNNNNNNNNTNNSDVAATPFSRKSKFRVKHETNISLKQNYNQTCNLWSSWEVPWKCCHRDQTAAEHDKKRPQLRCCWVSFWRRHQQPCTADDHTQNNLLLTQTSVMRGQLLRTVNEAEVTCSYI